jgi:AcrR family transcriptional regulator
VAKVGRPARISREAIAEAADALGLEDLTLRAVADRLGVSVASLYHHVDGKDDLLRLAAEHAAARHRIPEHRGEHWAAWLLAWAQHNRGSFVAEPALLSQYLDGAISVEVITESTEVMLGPLVEQGFTEAEAMNAYQLVTACALGSAVHAIREARALDADTEPGQMADVVATNAPDALPHVRALLGQIAVEPLDSFETRIATVLAGIAARRGEDWQAVVALVEPTLAPT